jgi:hypothetical protein
VSNSLLSRSDMKASIKQTFHIFLSTKAIQSQLL